ncbi:DUF3344 domain-containing protein, partial [Methanophagales archaeon]
MNTKKMAVSGVIALTVLAVMLAVVPSALAQPPYPANSTYFLPENSTGVYCQNNTIVQVRVNTTVDCYGPQVDIYFDTSCVNITDVNFTGSPWKDGSEGWSYPYGTDAGIVRILGGGIAGASGDNLLANITLHCINKTCDCTSYLDFRDTALPDDIGEPIPHTTHNGTINCTAIPAPDLKVEFDDPQYIFANLTNVLTAKITNIGNKKAENFVVAINITSDCTGNEVYNNSTTVSSLDPSASAIVNLGNWKPTTVENITINVTADYTNVTGDRDMSNNYKVEVRNTSCACGEYPTNPACVDCINDTMLPDTCYGYRGQHPMSTIYQGGSDVIYTVGDYKYKKDKVTFVIGPGGDINRITNTTADIPPGATIVNATLYVYGTWYNAWTYGYDPRPYFQMSFKNSSIPETPISPVTYYNDSKGFTTMEKYQYLTFVYDVTQYVTGDDTYIANRTTPGAWGKGYTSGMALMVIYDDGSSSNMKYKIAHGCDRVATEYIKDERHQYHVTPEDATTKATFPKVDKKKLVEAKLFTVTVDGVHFSTGVPTKESLKFNDCPWYEGAWSNEGMGSGNDYPIGFNRSDVTACIADTGETAYFQERDGSYKNGFSAVFACLRTKEGVPIISVEPPETIVQPQDQFDVNITVNPNGAPVYGVEYYLRYNTSVVRAETQNKGPFLGGFDDTVVVHNEIDHANGIVSYAETRKGPDGVLNPGTLATIQFTAIGERGATTGLNLTGVIIVNNATKKPYATIIIENGTVTIYDNIPPVAKGHSKFRYNYAAKKFESLALLCSNSTNPNEHKGYNITYVRWSFGDGQYGTSEGGLPDDARDGICVCKDHAYTSWKWTAGDYEPFNASVTVTDDGCPEASDT